MDGSQKVLWVDATNGASGDMLLGALLDAGASLDEVRSGLAGLAVEPIELGISEVRRHGYRAASAVIKTPPTDVLRNVSDVLGIVRRASLTPSVTSFAEDVFLRLARAEARVHGIQAEEVHFHEVGALDSIADVVGCGLALHSLGLLEESARIVSPVAVGSGRATGGHGHLPLPAPAVLELLTQASAPVQGHPAVMELCTPTGAALLTASATAWGGPPPCTPQAVGVGAGAADPSGHANILRVLIGAAVAETAGVQRSNMYQVETTVDDLDPRVWPSLLERLRTLGAADAWCTAVLMRKGRPGQVLTVLADANRLDLLCRVIFAETTTLGLRVSEVERRSLPRDQIEVNVGGSAVHVKRAYLDGRIINYQPEFDEVVEAAEDAGLSVGEVLNIIRREIDLPADGDDADPAR